MNEGGYTVEVTGLSPKVTEKVLCDCFSFSGTIEHVEIVRSIDFPCTGYVTFKDAYDQETAVLLGGNIGRIIGATIMDQCVCITRWGHYADEFDFWRGSSFIKTSREEYETESTQPPQRSKYVPSAGEAVTASQEVAWKLLKAVDHKYHVSDMTKSAISATGRTAAAAAAANTR
ncbi:hypothetical protein MANES_05G099033v8 [Manihot esculenta]|uniref:Uncharacterized protein n=1 Tax=Manihot esculenta TaxID=3983 RepID=A0ACB7HMV7_MANES|nr:hypothetical protein MANES_05G099033v8 [Manihot esculenta]